MSGQEIGWALEGAVHTALNPRLDLAVWLDWYVNLHGSQVPDEVKYLAANLLLRLTYFVMGLTNYVVIRPSVFTSPICRF